MVQTKWIDLVKHSSTTRTCGMFADHHRVGAPQYNPGNWVWLATKDYRNLEGCKKLSSRYINPYKILWRGTEVTYKLAQPDTSPQLPMCILRLLSLGHWSPPCPQLHLLQLWRCLHCMNNPKLTLTEQHIGVQLGGLQPGWTMLGSSAWHSWLDFAKIFM